MHTTLEKCGPVTYVWNGEPNDKMKAARTWKRVYYNKRIIHVISDETLDNDAARAVVHQYLFTGKHWVLDLNDKDPKWREKTAKNDASTDKGTNTHETPENAKNAVYVQNKGF
jgi:hypothetical protein